MPVIKKWKIVKSRPAFVNRWWEIIDETVALPDGSQAHFFVNKSPGGVVVFPLTAKGEVVLVRQYKHGARDILLELPVGRLEASDRSEREAALRELREETGYEPERLERIGSYELFPTSATGKMTVFIARGAKKVADPTSTPTETTEAVLVPMKRLRALLRSGKIASLIQVGAISAALDRLGRL